MFVVFSRLSHWTIEIAPRGSMRQSVCFSGTLQCANCQYLCRWPMWPTRRPGLRTGHPGLGDSGNRRPSQNYSDLNGSKTRTRKYRHSQECKHPHPEVFVPVDLDLWPFDPKINEFPGLMVEHFHVKFGYPSCSGYRDVMRMNRQTDTNAIEYPTTWLSSEWVIIWCTKQDKIIQ